MSVSTAATAERYLATFVTGDVAAIVALHAEEGQFHLHTRPDPVVGREAIGAAFVAVFDRWPGLTVESHRLLLGPDHWTLDWTMIGAPGRPDAPRFRCLDIVTLDPDGLVRTKDTYVTG